MGTRYFIDFISGVDFPLSNGDLGASEFSDDAGCVWSNEKCMLHVDLLAFGFAIACKVGCRLINSGMHLKIAGRRRCGALDLACWDLPERTLHG